MDALAKESRRRRLVLPDSFDLPDRAMWVRGYRSDAQSTAGLVTVELDDALAIMRGFLAGSWPESRRDSGTHPLSGGVAVSTAADRHFATSSFSHRGTRPASMKASSVDLCRRTYFPSFT